MLEIGDEAVVDTGAFTLEGRTMRGVRQAVSRTKRAGYTVRVRKAEDLPPAELRALAATWRGTDTERGFSMALGRMGDPGSVRVTAEHEGRVRGLLQFIPWGEKGLSMDVMCRDRTADNGVNELMISELLVTTPVDHVSLNFAACPVARLSARTLRFFSRWIQIESLYASTRSSSPAGSRAIWRTPRPAIYPASASPSSKPKDSADALRCCSERCNGSKGGPLSRGFVGCVTYLGSGRSTWEASPSLVYGAALLMRLGVTPPPGFKSRSLRWHLFRQVLD